RREPLGIREAVGEPERVGGADVGVALAKGAAIDRDEQPLRDRQPEVMAAARTHVQPPLEELPVVDVAAAGALLPDRPVAPFGGPLGPPRYPARAATAARIAARSAAANVATRPPGPAGSPSSPSRARALPPAAPSAQPGNR